VHTSPLGLCPKYKSIANYAIDRTKIAIREIRSFFPFDDCQTIKSEVLLSASLIFGLGSTFTMALALLASY